METRGYSVAGEYPKPLIGDTARHADRVIVLGGEAVVEIPHVTVERWNTVEPSLDGVVGMPRMELILDDIEQRVRKLRECPILCVRRLGLQVICESVGVSHG
ncbi:hypothetical protein ABMV15_14085 [Corynebacterium belfantii]|uniref:hypothetical protein n=1 Tax=Corynebacterium belfantii TaxID=2014537 RepID=UPI0035A8198B